MTSKVAPFLTLVAVLSLSVSAFGQAPVDLGTIQVSTLGHLFSPANAARGPIVQDFFIDQQQTSGGGGMISSVSANLDSNYHLAITITAPPGKKFRVHLPGSGHVQFGGAFHWSNPDGFYAYDVGTISATFAGLDGTPPSFDYAGASISQDHAAFILGNLGSSYLTSDISFSSITLTGSVTNNGTPVGQRIYYPSTNSLNQFYAIYYPPFSQSTDPGRFVSIISVPTLGIIRSSSAIAISWPTNFDTWVLEASTNLAPNTVWSPVTNSRVTIGTNFYVTNAITQPTRFYRMRGQ